MQLQLLKLLPNQIAEHWDSLRPTIEGALPPVTFDTQDRMYLVLEALMGGRLDCLVFYAVDEEKNVFIRGIVTITFDIAVGADFKTMFIYTLFGLGEYSPDLWMQAVDLLKKYAQGNNCRRITGLTNSRSLLALLRSLGAETGMHYIIWEV